jgi:hypothetical protein
MNTIADSLAPEVLEQLGATFLEGIDEYMGPAKGWDCSEYIEQTIGLVTGEHIWDALWRFGVVVDDDLSWYMPSDHDVVYNIITLDGPNRCIT